MKKRILLIISVVLIIFILLSIIFYNLNLKAVSSDDTEVEFVIEEGSTYYSVINKLKNENLIKIELCFKIYIKLNNKTRLETGTYLIRKRRLNKK